LNVIIGKNLGDYRILAKTQLGESGFVYKAVHIARRQTYALKLLSCRLTEEHPQERQIIRELVAAAKLDHPNIARTYPPEFSGQLTLIPLEFIYGQNLSAKISEGASTLDFTLRIALQAAQAVQEAHDQGLVHGRITSNSLVASSDGDLKMVDFGLDSISDEMLFADSDNGWSHGYFLAPPRPPLSRFAYLAPERVQGNPADVRSDLFSLGVVLYELLAGQFLFEGEDRQELFRQIQERDLPKISQVRSGIPSAWSKLLRGLLDKNPQKRYPSASSLIEDLRKLNYGMPLDLLSFEKRDPSISRRSFFRRFVGEDETE
jgi:eukaryotic-like serine/threonine-protein kinase